MVHTASILYALGAIATLVWLIALILTVPSEERPTALESVVLPTILALLWPVFWGFIMYGVWLGLKHDKGWRE